MCMHTDMYRYIDLAMNIDVQCKHLHIIFVSLKQFPVLMLNPPGSSPVLYCARCGVRAAHQGAMHRWLMERSHSREKWWLIHGWCMFFFWWVLDGSLMVLWIYLIAVYCCFISVHYIWLMPFLAIENSDVWWLGARWVTVGDWRRSHPVDGVCRWGTWSSKQCGCLPLRRVWCYNLLVGWWGLLMVGSWY